MVNHLPLTLFFVCLSVYLWSCVNQPQSFYTYTKPQQLYFTRPQKNASWWLRGVCFFSGLKTNQAYKALHLYIILKSSWHTTHNCRICKIINFFLWFLAHIGVQTWTRAKNTPIMKRVYYNKYNFGIPNTRIKCADSKYNNLLKHLYIFSRDIPVSACFLNNFVY